MRKLILFSLIVFIASVMNQFAFAGCPGKSKVSCAVTRGCEWNKKTNSCSRINCSVKGDITCMASLGCQWLEDKNSCVSTDCKLYRGQSCKMIYGCEWDGKECYKFRCSSIRIKEQCSFLYGCFWSSNSRRCEGASNDIHEYEKE